MAERSKTERIAALCGENQALAAKLVAVQARLVEATAFGVECQKSLETERERLTVAVAYIEALEQNLNDFVDLKTMYEAIAWRTIAQEAK